MSFDIRRATANAIERTGNPMAPIILQEAHKGVALVGRMMAGIADKDKTQAISETILNSLGDDAIVDKLCYSPEFICALSGMLAEALISYGRKLAGDPTI